MARWPKVARIEDAWWTIHYVPRDHPELANPDDPEDYCLGTCDFSTHEIYIESSQSHAAMVDTLVHEVCHAVYATCPGLDHEDEEAEENAVLFAARAFRAIVGNLPPFWTEPEPE